MSPSVHVESLEREITTHTASGPSTKPHKFVKLILNVPGPNGTSELTIKVDAGDFSRALASPGAFRAPVSLTQVSKPRKSVA